jgi:two-component system, sensor histidine kinase YesM
MANKLEPVESTKSVRSSIFRSFTLLILAALAAFLSFFYLYISGILRDRAVSALGDSALSMARSIDTEIAKMSNISLSVSGSGLLKRLFAEHAAIAAGLPESDARLKAYLSARRITELLVTIVGPLKPVPQVNLYDFSGGMIGSGTASGEFRRRLSDMDWYPDLDQHWGAKLVTPPGRDALLDDLFPLYRERSYVSLCRSFFDDARGLIGVVEVKQFYDEIFKDLSGRKEFVAVIDQDGRQIYPFAQAEGGGWGVAASRLRLGEAGTVELPAGRSRAIAITRECKQIGWRVLAARREADFLRPVTQFALLGGLVALLILAASALAVSRLALKITTPIGRMRSALASLELEDMAEGSPPFPPAGLDELEELEASFAGMQSKLRSSIRDALEAKTHETRATMLALQSQMDPHFIYNMLTIISIMAEERMNDSIREAIGHLTHLLRYISSGSSSYVTLAAEVEYARRYLACMKIRFGEGLDYSISLPSELEDIVVPKLIIQPLVENCMKYGINREPPWRVELSVSGGEGWRARVGDDGPGFPEAALESLNAPAGGGEALGIGGMGLRNIAARLRLYYADAAVFVADNRPEGGALVTIGGSLGRPEKI